MNHRFHPIKLAAKKMGARCQLCPLLKEEPVGALPVVSGRTLKLIIVGEAPGRTEIKLKKPFVGLSGKMVDGLLTANKLLRSETHLTNSAFCRSDKDKENDRASMCCAPRLLKELLTLPTNVPIVTLGATSSKSVIGLKGILGIRGFIWKVPFIDPKEVAKAKKAPLKFPVKTPARRESELESAILIGRSLLSGRIVLPSIHPSFVLRTETQHTLIRTDFNRIGRVVHGKLNLKRLDDRVKPIVTTDLRLLRRLGSVVALDIETTKRDDLSPDQERAWNLCEEAKPKPEMPPPYLHRPTCVGISDGATTIVLFPYRKKMAGPLSRFLRTRKTVSTHNGIIYDSVVLKEQGVF